MKDFFEKKSVLFISGAIVGLAARAFLKTDTARKAAVNTVAGGMQLKENASAAYETIVEDAKDLKEEAKRKNAK